MSEQISTPVDWRAERCGHNFAPENCPYDHCGYREALARIAALEAEVAALKMDKERLLAWAVHSCNDPECNKAICDAGFELRNAALKEQA